MVPERSPICLLRVYQVSKEVLLSPRYISAVFMKEQLVGNVDMFDHLGVGSSDMVLSRPTIHVDFKSVPSLQAGIQLESQLFL